MSILKLGVNTDYHNGKIYGVTFKMNNNYFIGSTIQDLDKELDELKLNPKSVINKYIDDKPKINLISDSPCKDKKTLDKICKSYIHEYKLKYSELLLNCHDVKKIKTKTAQFKVELESQKQLEKRLEQLGYKLRIKDDTIRSYFEIDARVDGKRVHHLRRYNKENKKDQYQELSEIQQKLVKDFTVEWN